MARAAFLPFSLAGAGAANVIYLGAAQCRRKFELFYPDGFEDETYLVAERSHKERAHLEWEAELGPAAFRKLLARGEFRAVADVAVRVESRANLLFSFERMALRDAVKTPAGARLFACELYAFLYGPGPTQRKFTDWVEAHEPQWKLLRHVPNEYPYRGDWRTGSFARLVSPGPMPILT